MAMQFLARISLAVGLLALSGCAFLSTVVENQYKLAAATDEACAEVDEAFVAPADAAELRKQLVSRLRLRLTGVVCESDCSTASPDFGRQRFDSAMEEIRRRIDEEGAVLAPRFERIDRSLGEIRKALATIEAALKGVNTALAGIETADCETKQACARRLLAAFGKLAASLDPEKAGSPYVVIEREISKIAADAAKIIAQIKQDYPDLAERLDIAVLDAQEIVLRAKLAVRLFIAEDVPGLAKEFFAANIRYEAAERVLRWFDSGLKSVDRIIDKADDRFFLFPTLVITAGESRIQSAFDTFYDRFLAKDLKRLDIELSFAKAACERLADSAPQSPQLMPFVHRMFATGFFRHKKDKDAAPAPADAQIKRGDVRAYVSAQSVRVGLPLVAVTAVPQKMESGGDGPRGAPMLAKLSDRDDETVPPLTGLRAYEECYVAEIAAATALRRESADRAPPPLSRSRELGARICGAKIGAMRRNAALAKVPTAADPHRAEPRPAAAPAMRAAPTNELRAAMQTYVRQVR
jgi:hypothetical protein